MAELTGVSWMAGAEVQSASSMQCQHAGVAAKQETRQNSAAAGELQGTPTVSQVVSGEKLL